MSLNQNKAKQVVVDALRDVPFINHAVRKAGVSRTTFYRWMKRDKLLKFNVNAALQEGHKNLIEIAESALAKKIKEGHFGAIKFYLENNHGNYMNRKYRIETLQTRNHEDSPAYASARMPEIIALTEEEMGVVETIEDIAEKENIPQEKINELLKRVIDGSLTDTLREIDEYQGEDNENK